MSFASPSAPSPAQPQSHLPTAMELASRLPPEDLRALALFCNTLLGSSSASPLPAQTGKPSRRHRGGKGKTKKGNVFAGLSLSQSVELAGELGSLPTPTGAGSSREAPSGGGPLWPCICPAAVAQQLMNPVAPVAASALPGLQALGERSAPSAGRATLAHKTRPKRLPLASTGPGFPFSPLPGEHRPRGPGDRPLLRLRLLRLRRRLLRRRLTPYLSATLAALLLACRLFSWFRVSSVPALREEARRGPSFCPRRCAMCRTAHPSPTSPFLSSVLAYPHSVL